MFGNKSPILKPLYQQCLIQLDISPRFIQILVDFIHNDQPVDHLRLRLKEFGQKLLDQWLMYLGMDNLIKTLNHPMIPPMGKDMFAIVDEFLIIFLENK